jgi:hypothetical protein
MITVLISILIFFITLFLHILYRRRGKIHDKFSMIIYLDFLFGFILNICIIIFISPQFILNKDNFIFTSILLNGLFTLAYIIFITSPIMGEDSPSSEIVLMARKYGSITAKMVRNELHEDILVKRRLDDMVRAKWIKYKNSRYYILYRGKLLSKLIGIYRDLLKIQTG